MDKFTKRGADGSVDVAASANAYAKELTAWVAQNEIPTERIEEAVEAVFDSTTDDRIAMPALVNMAVNRISTEPSQFKALTTRVHAYVTGQSADNTGRLDIAKGKGGGVARLAKPGEEVPARQAKKSA